MFLFSSRSALIPSLFVFFREEESRFSLVGQGSLQIRDLQEVDSGSYTCRASNLEDSVDSEASLTVNVPPRFVNQPANLEAQVNADVEFECNVYGQPRPTIQWLKNGDVLHSSDYFQIVDGQNLRILGLVNSDAGVYQCFAENEVGNVQASAQLLITQRGESMANGCLTHWGLNARDNILQTFPCAFSWKKKIAFGCRFH